MSEEKFWCVIALIGSVVILGMCGFGIYCGYASNQATNECYKILVDKSAAEMRITCGVIK